MKIIKFLLVLALIAGLVVLIVQHKKNSREIVTETKAAATDAVGDIKEGLQKTGDVATNVAAKTKVIATNVVSKVVNVTTNVVDKVEDTFHDITH